MTSTFSLMTSGKRARQWPSRPEVLDNLGVRPVQIAPQLNVDDGIQAVRSMLDPLLLRQGQVREGYRLSQAVQASVQRDDDGLE